MHLGDSLPGPACEHVCVCVCVCVRCVWVCVGVRVRVCLCANLVTTYRSSLRGSEKVMRWFRERPQSDCHTLAIGCTLGTLARARQLRTCVCVCVCVCCVCGCVWVCVCVYVCAPT